jgi:acyl-CoA thioesterase-1
MKHLFALFIAIVLFTILGVQVVAAEQKSDPALLPIEDDAKLPRVLLIGDSISMGYTLPVRELLKDKANVNHPPENCGETARGLKSLEKWLGEKKWDVIHFNFGLHDLKYLDENGKYVSPDKGRQVAVPEQYEKNLRELVTKLQATGAKLIFASTTPVPDGTTGRVKDDELRYNAAAESVMKESGIEYEDLHGIIKANPSLQLPKNVHFTPEGYKVLATEVVKHIESALRK